MLYLIRPLRFNAGIDETFLNRLRMGVGTVDESYKNCDCDPLEAHQCGDSFQTEGDIPVGRDFEFSDDRYHHHQVNLANLKIHIKSDESDVVFRNGNEINACLTGVRDFSCDCTLREIHSCFSCGHDYTCLVSEVDNCTDLESHRNGFIRDVSEGRSAFRDDALACCSEAFSLALEGAVEESREGFYGHLYLCSSRKAAQSLSLSARLAEMHISSAEMELIRTYSQIKSMRKQLENQEARLRAQIVSMSKEANWRATYETRVIAEFVTKNEKRFDSKMLRAEHPDLYERFRKPMKRGYLKILDDLD